MLPPRTFPLLLLLAVLGQQVSLASSARGKTRGADKSATPAPGRGQRAGDRPLATVQGRISIKDKLQCTWGARDVGNSVKLAIRCRNPEARAIILKCQYTARPQRCAGYLTDNKVFWKQVARALNRLQGTVCTDDRALVKARICKHAPRDSHFKLDAVSSESSERGSVSRPPPLSTSTPPAACTGRADHRKTAEEYCGGSWASACSFLFSVLQRDC